MSSDVEHFHVQRSEPLAPLLPRHVEWVDDDGEYAADDGERQLLVYEPEQVQPDEIPADLRGAVANLRFGRPPVSSWRSSLDLTLLLVVQLRSVESAGRVPVLL